MRVIDVVAIASNDNMLPPSLLVPLLCISFSFAATVPPSSSFIRAARTCDIAGVASACLETAFFNSAGDEFSFGFRFPELGSQNGELIITASLPLPYGFAAFTLGEASSLSSRQAGGPLQLVLFVDEIVRAQANPPPLNESHVRVQLSTGNGNGQLIPTGSSNVTISPLTSRTADEVQMVTRFQDSSLAHMPIFTTPFPRLSAIFSLNAPEYLDSAEQKAELYLNGSRPIEFVLDGMAAREGDFGTLLKDLELDS